MYNGITNIYVIFTLCYTYIKALFFQINNFNISDEYTWMGRFFESLYNRFAENCIAFFKIYICWQKTNTTYTVDAQEKMSTLLDCPIFHVIKKQQTIIFS